MSLKWRDRIQRADMEAIRRIVTDTGVFNKEEIDVAVELAEDRIKRSLDSDYHFIFADVDGAPVAYSCFGRIPFTDGRFDLYWIATTPDGQRRKIASQLLAITEGAVRSQGGKKLYAETSSRAIYLPAQKFYEKQGFTLCARLEGFYKDGDDKMLFSKNL